MNYDARLLDRFISRTPSRKQQRLERLERFANRLTSAPRAHLHQFDVHPTSPTMVACLVCGFAAPAILLTSTSNMDAITARRHCTEAVLALLGIDREGRAR